MNLFVNSFRYFFLDNIKKLTIFIMNCCILPCNATICFGYISMLPNSFHFRRVEGSIVIKNANIGRICQIIKKNYWRPYMDSLICRNWHLIMMIIWLDILVFKWLIHESYINDFFLDLKMIKRLESDLPFYSNSRKFCY